LQELTGLLAAWSVDDSRFDKRRFSRERARRFAAIDADSHEFLAQVVTYGCLRRFGSERAEQLAAVYDRLEAGSHRRIDCRRKSRRAWGESILICS